MSKWFHPGRYVVALGCLALSFIVIQNSSFGWKVRGGGETNKHRRHRPAGLNKIKHVIFLVKENRTFKGLRLYDKQDAAKTSLSGDLDVTLEP